MAGTWWREGVLYQVYLRSFADADGDGVGDLPGLISRLDHLAWLGIDGLWVTPVMPSPNADWGYDVADYRGVDPAYGTQQDVDRLVAEAGARGISVLFDLVPNHTSGQHPWFVSSSSSRDNPKRDWYVWADPRSDGAPPNNWVSNFFGPAWSLDETTGQFYLHSFLAEQPDLNWWNEGVREAFEDVLRFWFDRGVAGFRIDVVYKLAKDRALRDNPSSTEGDSPVERAWGLREQHNANLPETHEILRRWRRVADAYDPPRVLVGETYLFDYDTLASYYGHGDELHLNFNIPFLWSPFRAGALREVIGRTEAALGEDARPLWNGSSHDISRMATRWGEGDDRKIRCALMMLMTLRGTPLLYYGDEIGMGDGTVRPEQVLDPLARRVGGGIPGRDIARTPMQWAPGPGAGFTVGTPWLPIGDAAACNVEAQRADPGSVLHLCRDLIALRRELPDLRSGGSAFFDAPEGVLAWRRGEGAVIALNLSDESATVEGVTGTVRAATRSERRGRRVDDRIRLAEWEGVVVIPAGGG